MRRKLFERIAAPRELSDIFEASLQKAWQREKLNLQPAHAQILMVLSRHGEMSCEALGKCALGSKSSFYRHLRDMDDLGLLEKRTRMRSGRITRVKITLAGKDAWARASRIMGLWEKEVFGGLFPEELAAFNETLHKLAMLAIKAAGEKGAWSGAPNQPCPQEEEE